MRRRNNEFIDLNVGGYKYLTKQSTLCATVKTLPDEDEESGDDEVLPETEKHYFRELFSGVVPMVLDADECLLIDRDGKHFGYILNYLRSIANGSYSNYVLPWHDKYIIEELKLEAKYYGLNHLLAVLEEGDYDVTWNRYFEGSFILKDCKEHSLLNRWYGNRKQWWRLVYRGSRDALDISLLSKIYSSGQSITLVESAEGYTFGAYQMKDWTSDCEFGNDYCCDHNAFLFSLRNPHNDPQKLPIKDPKHAFKSNELPCFGKSDLCIKSNWSGSTNVGSTYQLPPERTGPTFFTGQHNFLIKDIEIYQPVQDSQVVSLS